MAPSITEPLDLRFSSQESAESSLSLSLQAETTKEKNRWTNELKRLLLMQLESLKEEQLRIRRGSSMLAVSMMGMEYDNR